MCSAIQYPVFKKTVCLGYSSTTISGAVSATGVSTVKLSRRVYRYPPLSPACCVASTRRHRRPLPGGQHQGIHPGLEVQDEFAARLPGRQYKVIRPRPARVVVVAMPAP